jgi:hypothetical protein
MLWKAEEAEGQLALTAADHEAWTKKLQVAIQEVTRAVTEESKRQREDYARAQQEMMSSIMMAPAFRQQCGGGGSEMFDSGRFTEIGYDCEPERRSRRAGGSTRVQGGRGWEWHDYKGGQFIPGGGRAPKGGCRMKRAVKR